MKAVFCLCVFLQTYLMGGLVLVHDLGNLAMQSSSAYALNSSGAVAGKAIDQGKVIDFLWDKEHGMQILTMDGLKEAYPRLNQHGQVAGLAVKKSNSWFSSDSIQFYLFDQQGFKFLGLPEGWKSGPDLSVVGINANTLIVVCNHRDPLQATKFAVWRQGKFENFKESGSQISAFNDKFHCLINRVESGYLFSTYLFKIINGDPSSKSSRLLSKNEDHWGIKINNHAEVIGRDKKGKRGFFWNFKHQFVDLGNKIPTSLNHEGDIVANVKEGSPWLLKADGQELDLNCIPRSGCKIDALLWVADINDNGQILAIAKIGQATHGVLLEILPEH